MRILLIGSGGREHALCWKLAQSPSVEKIFTAPGNPGTAKIEKNENVDLSADDLDGLLGFASSEGIDLTVVGPEKPLAEGLTDRFRSRHLRVFGPDKAGAQLEASKVYAKTVMRDVGIPTAAFTVLTSWKDAQAHLAKAAYPLVLKADGLAAGKGVAVCPDRTSAEAFARDAMENARFGDSGKRLVVEECLKGEEVSFLVLASGTEFLPLAAAQDHKRLLDNDQGPNTGGMGAYSPAPAFTKEIQKDTEDRVVRPLLAHLVKQGKPFTGVLYVGLMLTENGPKVLEFNARFGDPETQVLLPRLEGDLAELLYGAACGRLSRTEPTWKKESAVTVVLAAPGYPEKPQKDLPITISPDASREALLFHAGTMRKGDRLVTSGGRVFTVTALGSTFQQAADKAYRSAEQINFEGKHFRRDIARRVR